MSSDPSFRVGVADYGRRVLLEIGDHTYLMRESTATTLSTYLDDAAEKVYQNAMEDE